MSKITALLMFLAPIVVIYAIFRMSIKISTGSSQLTRLVLEPGQSHTIQWNWPTPDVDMSNSIIAQTSAGSVDGNNKRLDGGLGTVNVQFFYGPRREGP